MLQQKILIKARELGFNLIGFSQYECLDKEVDNLKIWLNKSFHAGMNYMEQNIEKRFDPKTILDGCESVISLGINYKTEDEFLDSNGKGKVSRYAWGRDYHYVVWEKLDELIEYINILDPGIRCKSYIDTGPVMDKAWAVRSGLGWLGKHSNVINRNVGSWFFIANIFTTIKFDDYNKQIPDYCGSCTACIDACPTNAIVEDYVIDSNKCISYLTIENKSEIPDQFLDKFENWIFGCDICQDVCPWNLKFTEYTEVVDFQSTDNMLLNLDEVEQLTNKSFNEKFKESAIQRARAKGLKRNAAFVKRSLNL